MNAIQHKNILITREAKGAKLFAEQLIVLGARPIIAPLLEITCIDPAMQTSIPIESCEWVFFTSKNGVECFLQDEEYAKRLHRCHIAAVGSKTAKVLEQRGYVVDFIPSRYNAETMAEEFLTSYDSNRPVLFVRGVLASSILLEAFTKAKRPFYCLEVYETKKNDDAKAILQLEVNVEQLDYLTFTSPSAIDSFVQLVEKPEDYYSIHTVCIGTTTERRAKELGFLKTIVPNQFTIEGMVHAMVHHSNEKG